MIERSYVKNASDKEQVVEAGKRYKMRKDNELDDLKLILNTEHGRRFIWRYLSDCGIFRSSYVTEPHDTAYNEGRRAVGLKLLAEVTEAMPEAYSLMVKENHAT